YHIGRLSSKIKTMNNVQTSQDVFTYTGNLVTSIAKKGASNSNTITESKEYDAFGNVIKETVSANDIQPLVKNYIYDTSGRYIESEINIDGLTTSYIYNKNKGWLLQKTNTHGLTKSYRYSPFGMVISQADYLGNVTNFVYKSGSPNVLSSSFVRKETTYPDGIKKKETTNAWGAKTFESITDIEGNWNNTSYTYDSQGRLIKKSEPYKSSATLFTIFEYDEYG